MPNQIALFRTFEERFRKPDGWPAPPAPIPIPAKSIENLEIEISSMLPSSYRKFMTNVGPCVVQGLADAWLLNSTIDTPPPFETLLSPSEIAKECSVEWLTIIPAKISGGQPIKDVAWNYLVPFAMDGGGNWHCFQRNAEKVDDAPVFYFDHDGGEIKQVADGLVQLVERFSKLTPSQQISD